MTAGFVHLHNHTDFSMLDGAARVADLAQRAAELGMSALAVTDHGNLFGAFEFYTQANKAGVKPIIGLESYLTPGTPRREKRRVQFGDGTGDDVAAKGAYTHMTMWSQNNTGMHNLFRLSSKSSLEGFFYKPRADRELLQLYHEGLIATTGCPSGEVQTYLRQGMTKQAVASAGEFQDIFGRENFFVELMDHGLDIENRVRGDLLDLAKAIGAPLVATNDLHYVRAEDAEAQDMLLCVSSGSRMSDSKRFKFDGSGYYLKTADEMRALFANLPEACDNTLAIAERCQISFEEKQGKYMPRFDVPAGHTEETWFRHEAEAGLRERYGDPLPPQVRQRADMEMAVIAQKGYPGYFLVVSDYVRWAKRQGIRVGPGRGSGAGSIIAYAMRITEIEPLRYELLFERFLNPERPSLPDFDIDFDERRRSDVIDYVTNKYGADHVAQIVTYGTIQAKQAAKDAARVLDKPYALGEQINKAMPAPAQGKTVSLKDIFDEDAERYAEGAPLRDLFDADPQVREVVEAAKGIEGLKRQWGVHACGMIMSSAPLEDVIPIMRRESDGAIITQFDFPSCETLGLVKMDFLGLRNLTILDDTLTNIKANQGVQIDLDDLSRHPDDPKVFELLGQAETLGVFQLDSDGIRSLLRLMQPDSFDDISAVVALYRPGPMGANAHVDYALRKTGRQRVVPIHPELADALHDILEPTYGLIVYQEQVLHIAQKVAGYSLGHADLLRKAMGKKKPEVLAKEYEPFSQGMRDNGYSDAAIKALWDILVPFSDYAFNKSHTVPYGMLAYWTAYLKANYPVEYMAALLESVKDDKDKLGTYLADCRRMGIKVLPPDVNQSSANFTPVGADIRFGLSAVRNVGDNVVAGILLGRKEHGSAKSFVEFLEHSALVVCNKRVIESLIKSGAFDSLGYARRALMDVFETIVDQIVPAKRNAEFGQGDLFADSFGGLSTVDGQEAIPEMAEWDKHTKLGFEREMLGLYVSDHPLHGLENVLASERSIGLADLVAGGGAVEGPVTICGMVTLVQRKQTKQGALWAILTVEDLDASVPVMVFPKVYEGVAAQLAPDTVVRIKGRVVIKDESVEVQASEVTFPDVKLDVEQGPVVIQVPARRCTVPVVDQLKQILGTHPGATEVQLKLLTPGKATTFRLADALRVQVSQPLMADLKALLGPACLRGVGV
ncbi:MAG: DNA polymerase III subunit alpha [Propionibacteriaceae bacterium]|nr:DNA polymerase III subunit alpha [Propionibacteriaceae bacterium]